MRYEQGQQVLVTIFGKTPADSGIFTTTINQIHSHQEENEQSEHSQRVEVETPLGRVIAWELFESIPAPDEYYPENRVIQCYLVAGPNAPGAPMVSPQDQTAAAPAAGETVTVPAPKGDRVGIVYNGPPQQHAIDMLVKAFGPAAAGMGHVAAALGDGAAKTVTVPAPKDDVEPGRRLPVIGTPKTLYIAASLETDDELEARLESAGVAEFFDAVVTPSEEEWEAAKKTTSSGELPII